MKSQPIFIQCWHRKMPERKYTNISMLGGRMIGKFLQWAFVTFVIRIVIKGIKNEWSTIKNLSPVPHVRKFLWSTVWIWAEGQSQAYGNNFRKVTSWVFFFFQILLLGIETAWINDPDVSFQSDILELQMYCYMKNRKLFFKLARTWQKSILQWWRPFTVNTSRINL